MNLKFSIRPLGPASGVLITPLHLMRPNVVGSTCAKVRARFRTCLVVSIMSAAGLDIIVSIMTLPLVSPKSEIRTVEFSIGMSFMSRSANSSQMEVASLAFVFSFILAASRIPFAATIRGICSTFGF